MDIPAEPFWHSNIQPLMVICPNDHSLVENPEPLNLTTLAQIPMALWKPGYGVRWLAEEVFSEADMRLEVALEANLWRCCAK